MELGLALTEKAVRVQFGEDGYVLLRYLTPAMAALCREKATRMVMSGPGAEEPKFDALLYAVEVGQAVVKGWENLKEKGSDIAFNPANVSRLMRECREFSDMVIIHSMHLWKLEEAERASAAKK